MGAKTTARAGVIVDRAGTARWMCHHACPCPAVAMFLLLSAHAHALMMTQSYTAQCLSPPTRGHVQRHYRARVRLFTVCVRGSVSARGVASSRDRYLHRAVVLDAGAQVTCGRVNDSRDKQLHTLRVYRHCRVCDRARVDKPVILRRSARFWAVSSLLDQLNSPKNQRLSKKLPFGGCNLWTQGIVSGPSLQRDGLPPRA